MLKVAKFGGSSMANAEQFAKVRDIIHSDPARRVVVVSAAGKRNSEDHKLTDLLYLCHAHLTYGVPCDDIWGSIRSRFIGIRDELGLKMNIEAELDRFEEKLNRDLNVDELVSRGEYYTAKLMAEYLGFTFVDAADCIIFGYNGKLDTERTYAAISDVVSRYGKVLLPGFYGSLPNGKIKVMTRGGSDITGALAAAALNADIYENWTDVSGILMADPRIVSDPRPISNITYAELRELAYMGASVLHEDAVQPVRELGIPLNIRNTNCPEDPGTMILETASSGNDSEKFITGIAGKRNYSIITIQKHDMQLSETLRHILELFDQFRVPVEHITMGLDSFALVVSNAALGNSLYDILGEIRKEKPDDIKLQENIALVAAVGRKMAFRPGTSGRLFNALGKNGISIRTIAQGADELSIIVGVENSQFENAIRVMYNGFAV